MELVLSGINGSNPLGFLAALGTTLTMRKSYPDIRLSWRIEGGTWQPVVHGCTTEKEEFTQDLFSALKGASLEPFEIERKLPFAVDLLVTNLKDAQTRATLQDRRLVDFLAAFGTEVYSAKEVFNDTLLRMVRSGDSAGQGLLAYAATIRRSVDAAALRRTLFEAWSYQDDGPLLRWDPVDDQRYALVWDSPEDKKKKQIKSMLGAHALALESLVLFPVIPTSKTIVTTGFHRSGRHEFFTWPIWPCPVSLDVVRSLLSMQELHMDMPDRAVLAARGIPEIYRCERIAPNKYYKNFTPSFPA